jgi:hypothetical protein
VVRDPRGHRSVQVTLDLYSHVSPALQRDAADRLGAALAGPPVADRGIAAGGDPDPGVGKP